MFNRNEFPPHIRDKASHAVDYEALKEKPADIVVAASLDLVVPGWQAERPRVLRDTASDRIGPHFRLPLPNVMAGLNRLAPAWKAKLPQRVRDMLPEAKQRHLRVPYRMLARVTPKYFPLDFWNYCAPAALAAGVVFFFAGGTVKESFGMAAITTLAAMGGRVAIVGKKPYREVVERAELLSPGLAAAGFTGSRVIGKQLAASEENATKFYEAIYPGVMKGLEDLDAQRLEKLLVDVEMRQAQASKQARHRAKTNRARDMMVATVPGTGG